jgi:hypothetical protein
MDNFKSGVTSSCLDHWRPQWFAFPSPPKFSTRDLIFALRSYYFGYLFCNDDCQPNQRTPQFFPA